MQTGVQVSRQQIIQKGNSRFWELIKKLRGGYQGAMKCVSKHLVALGFWQAIPDIEAGLLIRNAIMSEVLWYNSNMGISFCV